MRKNLRKSPSQSRSRATVDAILEASARILTTNGYDSLSTNKIAIKAGVSIGSLYQYFPNKESIMVALVERLYEEDRALIEAGLLRKDKESLEELTYTLVSALLETFQRKRKLREALINQVPRTGALKKVDEIRDFVEDLLIQYLIEKRYYSDGSQLRMRVHFTVAAVESILYSSLFKFSSSLDEKTLINEIHRLVVSYLRP